MEAEVRVGGRSSRVATLRWRIPLPYPARAGGRGSVAGGVGAAALLFLLLTAASGIAQDAVTIRVDGAQTIGPFKPIYAYFGYDEPNYTYAKNGRKLVGELAALSGVPVYIRTHFLLASGDGTPGLKWGSTNAYTEDASGLFSAILRRGAPATRGC